MNRQILTAILFASLGTSLCLAQAQPTADSLLAEVKQSQDWLAKAKSLHIIYDTQQLNIRSDAPATRAMTDTTATAPPHNLEFTTSETAFDQTRFYSRIPLNFGSRVVYFDGKVAGTSQRDGFFQLSDLSDSIKQSFTQGQTYGRNGQNYWWQVEPNKNQHEFISPGDAVRLFGHRQFHDVDCYVLESLRADREIYVGVADHRLYGQMKSDPDMNFFEWFTDYKEVAPNCWYPMTIGHDDMIPAGAAAGNPPPIDTYRTIRRVKQIDIDKPLPDTLFTKAIPDGSHVHDTSAATPHDYVFQGNRSPPEKAEIDANAARQALFAPPALVPGQPVVLGPPLDPLPLSPLALNPAADFPPGTKWIGSDPKKLADLKGKVVLLYFWATWQDYAEGLLQRTVPDFTVPEAIRPNVIIIGIHVPTTEPARVQAAIKDHKLPFPTCIDVPVPKSNWGTMAQQYRVDELPVTYVIDQDGKIATLGTWKQATQAAGELLGKP